MDLPTNSFTDEIYKTSSEPRKCSSSVSATTERAKLSHFTYAIRSLYMYLEIRKCATILPSYTEIATSQSLYQSEVLHESRAGLSQTKPVDDVMFLERLTMDDDHDRVFFLFFFAYLLPERRQKLDDRASNYEGK